MLRVGPGLPTMRYEKGGRGKDRMGRTREESKENQMKASVSSSSQEQGTIGLTLSGLLTNFH